MADSTDESQTSAPEGDSGADSSKRKIKQIFVNKKFQLQFIAIQFISVLWVVVIIQFSNLYFFRHFAQLANERGLGDDHPVILFLTYQRNSMGQISILSCLAAGVVIFVMGAFLSHRIAGPVHRVRQYAENLDKDNPKEITFREKDFFPDLADSINMIVNKLKK